MRIGMLIIAAAVALLPVLANAQATQPTCVDRDKSLPSEMAAWTAKSDLVSATSGAGLGNARLVLGKAASAALHRTPEVTYLTQPEKPGEPATYGGMLGLTVDRAGDYAVALGARGWIDVVKGGKTTHPAGHGHGPACSTIHKIVEFDLEPGVYAIQISGSSDPAVAVMAWRKP